jgi:hypothetical protein
MIKEKRNVARGEGALGAQGTQGADKCPKRVTYCLNGISKIKSVPQKEYILWPLLATNKASYIFRRSMKNHIEQKFKMLKVGLFLIQYTLALAWNRKFGTSRTSKDEVFISYS